MMPIEAPLVSVIMPTYNAEKTIGRAVDSVLNQTYENTELIIVNDGSTDGTIDVVGQYNDSRIMLVNQANTGLPGARNTGLRNVKGDYVVFIDSDDWYESDYVESLISSIRGTQSQLVVCGMIAHKHSSTSRSASFDVTYDSFFENADFLSKFESGIMNSVCNKLYKTTILKEQGLKFKKISIVEDLDFNLRYLDCIKKVCFISNFLYHYDNTFSVLTTKVTPDMFDNYIHIHAWLFSRVPVVLFPIVSSFVYHQYVALFLRFIYLYKAKKIPMRNLSVILIRYLSNPLISYSIKTYQSTCVGDWVLNKLLVYKQVRLVVMYMYLVSTKEKIR